MVYSRTTPFLIALTFLVAPMMANAVVPASTYKAVIGTISDTSYNVTGVAIVFAADDNSTVAYAGIIDGLMPSSSNACIISGDANGCGVHIHAGFSCENDSTLQGDNYFVDPVTQDPWTEERYYYSTSNNSWITGKANFAGLINIGSTSNLNGRAFIGKWTRRKQQHKHRRTHTHISDKLTISRFHAPLFF